MREARNTKASTQGYVKEQLAYAAAAAASADSQGRRKEHLEGNCDLGKQSRSARRNEKRHGSGNGRWKQQANSFKKWTLVLISVNRKSSQMHSRKKRSEYSRHRKSENWFEHNLYSQRPS